MISRSVRFLYRLLMRPARPVISRILPDDALWYLPARYARWRFHKYVRQNVSRYWFRDVAPGPKMSDELRLMTRALDEESLKKPYSTNEFYFEAYKQLLYFFSVLERYSFNLRTVGAVLDFGCGSARLLRMFRCIDGVRLVGVDANPACVDWCRGNVPGCEYYVNNLRPPLSFGDNEFDLILSYSVFTHVPLDRQRAWLEDLRRVLRPGGFFLCTVMGWNDRDAVFATEDREQLARERHVTFTADHPRASLSSQVIRSWDVFQMRDQVVSVFGSVFRLRDFLPAVYTPLGQDLLVLQKEDTAATQGGPEPKVKSARAAFRVG